MPVKITDLDTSTTITSNDLIQIIDVDDRRMSPAGTNRKITASNAANQLANLISSVPPVMVTALSTKANLNSPTFDGNVVLPTTTSIGPVNNAEIGRLSGVTSGIQGQLDLKAPLNSPNFSGNSVISNPNNSLSTAIRTGSLHSLEVYGARTLSLCAPDNAIRGFGIGGTVAAPAALADNTSVVSLNGFAWNGSGFNGYGYGGIAGIHINAKGAQTTSNGGGYITFHTTPQDTVNASIERVRIDHNGNVGIGTSSPTEKLSVVSDAATITRFSGPATPTVAALDQGIAIQPTQSSSIVQKNGFIDFRNENDIAITSINSFHYPDGGSDLAISATNIGSRTANRRAEIVRIKGNGNVGIGTNSPGARLSVASNAQRYDSAIVVLPSTHATSRRAGISLGGWALGQDANADGVTDSFFIWDSTRARMTFHGSGAVDNVIIWNVNNGNQYWYYNKSNIAGVVSDERTKNTIQKLDTAEALEYINRISPSTFISNGDTELQAGFIAQDLLENATTLDQKTTINNHKTYDKNNPDCPILGVADRPLVAYLVAAMQEQQKIIDTLQTRLEILENKGS
jgi:hypothetical protein